jgi:zinc transporter ZupT
MVLIESGFTFRQALLFNFVSACTAIIGFFVGASIAQDEGLVHGYLLLQRVHLHILLWWIW